MSEIPADLVYTKSHEWIRDNGDGTVTVGITDHAQELLGDLVFIELPEKGVELTAGDACAVIESVKAASDAYAPLDGEVVEINEDLADSPELINDSPYDEGWMYSLSLPEGASLAGLLSAEDYEAVAED